MEYTEKAKVRIEIAKAVVDAIKEEMGNQDENWHIYTQKRDQYNPDPDTFHVHRTKAFSIPLLGKREVPGSRLFTIAVNEDKECVAVLQEKMEQLPDGPRKLDQVIQDIKTYDVFDIKKWIIRYR